MVDKLEFHFGYYNEPEYRVKLNDFVSRIFNGFSFDPWNALGLNFKEYTPFSLIKDGKVVANVSASPMHLIVDGQRVDSIQIGTVGTLPEFRNRGLIRSLMKKVDAHWEGHRTFDFLFANQLTAEFYKQFGFLPVPEYNCYVKAPDFNPSDFKPRKLNLTQKNDRSLLFNVAQGRYPVSQRLGVVDHTWLLLFHAATDYRENMVHIKHLDAVVISKIEKQTLHIIDVIGEKVPTFKEIFPVIGVNDLTEVAFHFTPDLMDVGDVISDIDTESLLFVRGKFPNDLSTFRFPHTCKA